MKMKLMVLALGMIGSVALANPGKYNVTGSQIACGQSIEAELTQEANQKAQRLCAKQAHGVVDNFAIAFKSGHPFSFCSNPETGGGFAVHVGYSATFDCL